MSISSNIASKASVSHHFLCVQCARLAIMAVAGGNRTSPQILRLATGLRGGRQFNMFMSENICTMVDLFDKVVAEG